MTEFADLLLLPLRQQEEALGEANRHLVKQTPPERVAWALKHLPREPIVSSSFGLQAAVMLHLVTQLAPRIPVVFVDTGYLFPETYRFADALTRRLGLNLQVYQPALSAAWAEARYGQLWLEGEEGIRRYNQMHKVEPMQRALRALGVGTWFAGLRRTQASTREHKPVLEISRGTAKVYPIVEWSDDDVHRYMATHSLPCHPLTEQGYDSVGDVHTTARLQPGMKAGQTRFFGLSRECGLHLDGDGI